ncbi:hypothetical protein SCRM01_072c [Synechococcus phage S-CRM01]|uniref:hypothetical protein n=1 Tax=Synechococcus phage S-CRM01 TaxID=1026955 RepID=UPI000209E384|nr:hypothetical protein SCRM01_072c [Synechococcus phage S-CRM01]AEC53018.1 hypothetical protein SCRM01_072c [Synechococcus phage S-CRM01]
MNEESKFTPEYHDELMKPMWEDEELRQFLIDNKFANEDGTTHPEVVEILERVREIEKLKKEN